MGYHMYYIFKAKVVHKNHDAVQKRHKTIYKFTINKTIFEKNATNYMFIYNKVCVLNKKMQHTCSCRVPYSIA